jgi:hypothetical protein
MSRRPLIDWLQVKNDYIHDGTQTCATLAARYSVSMATVRKQIEVGHWVAAREKYFAESTQKVSEESFRSDAERLAERKEKYLRKSDELWAFLEKLEQQKVPMELVTKTCKLIAAYGELHERDRVVLGAATPGDRSVLDDPLRSMSERELLAEVEKLSSR